MVEKLDTYGNLCTQVYDLSKPLPSEESYALYKKYVSEANGHILEPMCGTGRFLLPFVEDGFVVQGFDASESMLEQLRLKAKAKNLSPNIWCGFTQDLKRTERYALIFIPSGSFGLIIDLAAAKDTLQKFYDHLSDGGKLVFEVETIDSVPSSFGMWRSSLWPRADGKFILANFLDLPLQNDVGTVISKYELVEGNSIIQTEVENFKFRIYSHPQMLKMLQEVGFKDIAMTMLYEKSASREKNDESMVYVCRK